MEGIFGILDYHGPVNPRALEDMARPLGIEPETDYVLDGQLGFGMRRLPLIGKIQTPKLTWNKNKNLCVAINGEINNYAELRQYLEHHGYEFISDSDAELIANLYLDKGEGFVKELNGLFVIAIWDSQKKELILTQDRYAGIRQLYYAQLPGSLVFGSSIRAILASGALSPVLDTDSLIEFFAIGRVLPPYCMFQGIRKLLPGNVLKCHEGDVSVKRVYGFSFLPKIKTRDFSHLEEIYTKSMERSLTSDKSPGLLLSGGFDSSLNVAMASRLSPGIINTYSLGFTNSTYDESPFARLVSARFKTQHHEFFLESEKSLEILPQLVWCQEEPLSDFSAVPSFHLARFAKSSVDVVLAGDGSDHLWGRQYQLVNRRRFINSLPGIFLVKRCFKTDRSERFSKYYPIKVAQKLARVGNDSVTNMYLDAVARYLGNTSNLKQAPRILSGTLRSGWQERTNQSDAFSVDGADDFNCLVTCDFIFDGSFGVFSKFGKVAAEHSLQVREPLLDNALVDFINRLPEKYKVGGTVWQRLLDTAEKKYLIRQILGTKLLPQEIMNKPKAGFTPPMNQWLRKYLEKFGVKALLSPSVRQAGYFNTDLVERLYNAYLEKAGRSVHGLYMLLSFGVWHRLYIDSFKTSGPTATLTEILSE